jgi:hypothetical protein
MANHCAARPGAAQGRQESLHPPKNATFSIAAGAFLTGIQGIFDA